MIGNAKLLSQRLQPFPITLAFATADMWMGHSGYNIDHVWLSRQYWQVMPV